jgi:hypothetical protein
MENKQYVIVKYAGEDWAWHFKEDPKIHGATRNQSARWTYSGKIAKLEEIYDDLDTAEKDCARINTLNPAVGYGVCPLIELATSINDHD